MKIAKTLRRVGVHRQQLPTGAKKIGGTLIGNQIKPIGPIKTLRPKKYGGFPPGHVY